MEEHDVRRVLDALRTADLVALPDPSEILVALPNTRTADARVVETRLRGTVPGATLGTASYKGGETAEDLVQRARSAVLGGAPGEP